MKHSHDGEDHIHESGSSQQLCAQRRQNEGRCHEGKEGSRHLRLLCGRAAPSRDHPLHRGNQEHGHHDVRDETEDPLLGQHSNQLTVRGEAAFVSFRGFGPRGVDHPRRSQTVADDRTFPEDLQELIKI